MRLKLFVMFGFYLVLTGCIAPAATVRVPVERRTECEKVCVDVGLEMSALVIMGNRAGCVCEKPGAQSSPGRKGGAIGQTSQMIEEEEAAQQSSRR